MTIVDHGTDLRAGEITTEVAVVPRVAPDTRTTLPGRDGPTGPVPERRPLGKLSRDELFMMLGAAISALSTTMLLFGRLTPLSGAIGFVVVAFVLYLVIYAFLVSLDNNAPAVVDRVMTSLMTAAAVTALVALASVIGFVFWRAREVLFRPNFYTEDMGFAGPLSPLDEGGISHAIVGTFIIMGLSLLFTVPLSIACAVYLNETHGRLTEFVRSVVTAMTALPSIVAGLFIFAMWVLFLGYERSGLAAALAISIMMLPIIVRSADVVLRLVPGSLREASAALGAPQWRTVWSVVLPTARAGLSTSVILGIARGIGETAPVLLVSGLGKSMNLDPLHNPMTSLPLAAFDFVRSPQETLIIRGFGTAAVLMILVLVLFTAARILGGRPAGHLSKRQAKRAAAGSLTDLERIETATAGGVKPGMPTSSDPAQRPTGTP